MGMRRLLLPLTPAYRLALAIREFRLRRGWEPVRRLGFPVISIGNLSTGGAGKTPFAIALAKLLSARGFGVDVLSRGYGRKGDDAARVEASGSADESGDEPVLIAREAGVPVFVGAERYEAGRMAEREESLPSGAKARVDLGSDAARLKSCPFKAEEAGRPFKAEEAGGPFKAEAAGAYGEGPRVHILDDGFQHRQLHRDVNIMLVNGEDLQDRLLPGGNLREPRTAAKRADVIAVPEDEAGLERELEAWGWKGPVWRMGRRMEVPEMDGPVVAFCGIARPEQFFAGLEAEGLRIAARIAFPDHHRYTARDLERIMKLAKGVGASSFVTTQKDEIRLESLNPGSWSPTFATKDVAKMGHGSFLDGEGLRFFTAGLRIEIQDEEAAVEWLIRRLSVTGAGLSV